MEDFRMGLYNFEGLDERLQKLLESYDELKAENRKLGSLLKVKKSENDWLKERLKALDSEKGLVKDKVDDLIERLENIV